MHHMSVTPVAITGLFVAHRAYDAKGSAHIRAMVDADRIFIGGQSPLLKSEGDRVFPVAPEGVISIALENHVFEHLSRALEHAQNAGLYGYKDKQFNPQLCVEAEDALKSAEKRDAPAVPPKPALVEREKSKKSG